MTDKQADLHMFFSDKAKHIQNEIEIEIEKIGGEEMLISREDLMHWVYHAREQAETYRTICRMLEEQTEGSDADKILRKLQESVTTDQADIARISRKQEEEQKALNRLRKEVDYYQQALEVLGKQQPSNERNPTRQKHYQTVFEFQEDFPTREQREEKLKAMSDSEIDQLIRSCGTIQGKIYYSKFKKGSQSSLN